MGPSGHMSTFRKRGLAVTAVTLAMAVFWYLLPWYMEDHPLNLFSRLSSSFHQPNKYRSATPAKMTQDSPAGDFTKSTTTRPTATPTRSGEIENQEVSFCHHFVFAFCRLFVWG